MFLFEIRIYRPNPKCSECRGYLDLFPYTKNINQIAWRCMRKEWKSFQKYFSIKKGSLFDGLNSPLIYIISVIIICCKTTAHSMILERPSQKVLSIKLFRNGRVETRKCL